MLPLPRNRDVVVIDNGDGTITDLKTGLMWEQRHSGSTYTWEEAVNAVAESRFAGYSDWRLPVMWELITIVDYSRSGPAIDPIFKAVADNYWSATTYAPNPDVAWQVNFNIGLVDFDDKNFTRYVRAVRTGSKEKP